MARKLKIGLVQFNPLPPDHSNDAHELNLKKAHQFVRDAAAQGAQIVTFPEYFLSGVVSDPEHHHLAQRSHDPSIVPGEAEADTWLLTFQELAKELKIDIVVGTIVEKSGVVGEDGKPALLNISNYVSGRTGEVIGRYKKRNLWWPEKDYLTAGEDEEHTVFQTDYAKTGLLVCWDMAWSEAWRSLLLQGAEVVICPTFWTGLDGEPLGMAWNKDCEATYLDSLVVTRAFENECVVVFVNVGGPESAGFIGRSAVTAPFIGKVGGTDTEEEQLKIVEVDLDVLKDARRVYGMRRDLENKIKRGVLPKQKVLEEDAAIAENST